MKFQDTFWTPEREKKLIELYDARNNRPEIARLLGCTTTQVKGKLTRLVRKGTIERRPTLKDAAAERRRMNKVKTAMRKRHAQVWRPLEKAPPQDELERAKTALRCLGYIVYAEDGLTRVDNHILAAEQVLAKAQAAQAQRKLLATG